MASLHEKLGSASETSPLEHQDDKVLAHGLGCFGRHCLGWRRDNNGGVHGSSLLQQQGETMESWLVEKVKKMVRRISMISDTDKKIRRLQFQYDPRSYALNFDDGVEENNHGETLDFMAGFVVPLGKNSFN